MSASGFIRIHGDAPLTLGKGEGDFQASQCIPMDPDAAAADDARCGQSLRVQVQVRITGGGDGRIPTPGYEAPKIEHF